MTPKAYQILDFIRDFIAENRFAPTIAEIAVATKMRSRGTVYRYVQQLVEHGHIKIQPGKQRNVALTQQGWRDKAQGLSLPLLGKIAAGRPIEAVLQQEKLDMGMLLGDDRYVLKICGDSMIEEGIHDGDLVICRHADRASNGDIVVALVDNAFATLKRFFHTDQDSIMLKPANANFTPVTYAANRVTIQGVFVGLLRLPNY